ncbi:MULTISPECIES: D-alanine--D-alanine ligase [Corallococcus]|uniref:D-alanine--D-alanine ligase n=1 Tax=Corallococcus TaxID=83461 RepID=UPI00118006D0|nr:MULTISPECIES: D-alanine--D-alanine ligase [Corallococcus]NBD11585.1 D-alanine--D-alanine ligase [Corallococcus silvisoli]TSC32217.1 D-alanine--D-alanine ligase [Corallococcus sp. Z5C101001]
MGKRVGVLMGGWGEEREISLKTGEAVVAALETLGHAVTRVFAGPGLDRALRSAELDVAFLALHGRMGEDGRVQGLLELLELPYTGSGVLASALAMDKPMAKKLFQLHNLATPRGYRVGRADVERALELHGDSGFPCVVKPAKGGSSVGLSVVHDAGALVPAVAQACRFGGEALVERFVRGQEVTVGILGDAVLGSCEVSFPREGFDYEAKYKGGSQYFLPPRLSDTRRVNVESLALAAYRALGCRGYGRVDLLCSDTENDVVLEVNTLPGFTPTSLLPKIAAHAGLDFPELVQGVLDRATRDEAQVAEAAPLPVTPAPLRVAR